MTRPQPPHTPPSAVDGDGVRVIRRASPGGRSPHRVLWLALALAAGGGVGYWLYLQPAVPPSAASAEHALADGNAAAVATLARSNPAALVHAAPLSAASVAPESPDDYTSLSDDANDLAAYVSSDDPLPSVAELIEALHDNGIYSGLGAFNPPGTSPPLHGLVVPEDFELPEGYVRHHQVTDDGEPIEPILMFSPDFEFRDDAGQLVEIPADRVVPPELAPPGMPIRPVEIPSSQTDAG